MRLKFKKLNEDAKLPTRANPTDAGLDLYNLNDIHIYPRTRELIPTGLAVEIPFEFCGFVQPRSGLAVKKGLTVLNTPGLIDSGYRGEIKVLLYNSSDEGVSLSKFSRIAQLVIIKVPFTTAYPVEELDESDRGTSGFGSTGE